jgi:hypothetical protein
MAAASEWMRFGSPQVVRRHYHETGTSEHCLQSAQLARSKNAADEMVLA